MPLLIDEDREVAIKTLLELKWSTRMIVKHFKKKGVQLSQTLVNDIRNNKGKRREAKLNGQQYQQQRARPKRTKQLVKLVEAQCKKENPPTQSKLATQHNCALSTINNIIHKDLALNTRSKPRVHRLNEGQKLKRAKAAKKLLANQLTDDNLEFSVTMDEAWLGVQDCNRKSDICYVEKGETVPEEWVNPKRETFGPKIMAVGILTGRAAVPLFFVPPKVKIDARYYIDYVLKPLVDKILPELYPGELNRVWVHHDAAPAHTAGITAQFMNEVTESKGISFIKKDEIPIKSPDASPLDFFGFGYLKVKLRSRRVRTVEGLKRAANQEWCKIDRELIERVFKSWQNRLKLLVRGKGEQIESFKSLHNKNSS